MIDRQFIAPEDAKRIVHLAIGRIWGMMQRPHREDDEADFDRCRGIILDLSEPQTDMSICYARDRWKGASGD